VLAVSVMLSRVLGFVREAVLANRVGAGVEMDAYRTAFQIPDLLNYFLAGGALSIAFIPMYVRMRGRDGEAAALESHHEFVLFQFFGKCSQKSIVFFVQHPGQ